MKVIFKEDSREKDIRDLLSKTETGIISGPAPNGIYILVVNSSKTIETILDEFGSSPIVKFAGENIQ